MKVTRISFLGVRTPHLEETVRFFGDVMGIERERGRETSHLARMRLPDDTIFELFSEEDEDHAFFTDAPVVGFRVEDFDEASDELLAAGVQFIGPPQHEDGISWNHFYGPDGNIYEIMGPGLQLI